MNQLDPEGAAYYAVIAVGLVLVGALLTIGVLSVEQRGTVLAGVIASFMLVAYRWRKRGKREE